jgi:hypothetical protein
VRCFAGCRSMSSLCFSAPCRIVELRDLPPQLTGWTDIPDSVEVFEFVTRLAAQAEYFIRFGRDSRLTTIRTTARRSFLGVSSRILKLFRSTIEFAE